MFVNNMYYVLLKNILIRKANNFNNLNCDVDDPG